MSDSIPGKISVVFQNDIRMEEAADFLNQFQPQYVKMDWTYRTAIINVEEGKEDEVIKKLLQFDTKVVSANRISGPVRL